TRLVSDWSSDVCSSDLGRERRRFWKPCYSWRPFIITGGELALEMLDLSYNKVSKIYDAPFQLKANNGIYLIDDFGRQKATPAERSEKRRVGKEWKNRWT